MSAIELKCDKQALMCKAKMHLCNFVGREEKCPHHSVKCGGENVPTFDQWIKIYSERAEKRHVQTGMLGKESIRHIVHALREFVETMGYSYDAKVSLITRKTLAEYCSRVGGRGVTLKAKCQKIGQSFARWVRYETEDEWMLPSFSMPDIKDDSERFHEPSPDVMLKIAVWYRDLYGRGRGMYLNKERLYVTMMYHYAMRNGDCNTLKWSNIRLEEGRPRLVYMPNKTHLSSKRTVKIWMTPLDYYDLTEYRKRQPKNGDDDFIFGGGKNIEMQNRLNKEIKALGIDGSKGLYICRKLCTHAALKEHGKEHAEAISGDDYKTIQFHYSDVSAIECSVPSSLCS